jgi:hypothetical protein
MEQNIMPQNNSMPLQPKKFSTEALKTCSGKRKAYPINHAEKTGYSYAEG